MEEQYDIRFNRPEPSSEAVNGHQDFDALLAALSENEEEQKAVVVPMRVKRRPYWTIAAAVVLLLAAYPAFKMLLPPAAVDESTYFASHPFVNPPATANVPDLVAAVVAEPNNEQQIPLENGQLILSSTAFMADRGKAIKKPVQVHYRQMDEVADYFMAGLPLQYTTNNQKTQLDAAVVLDVHATAAGEPLDIAAGQNVIVELNTVINNDGSGYQIYQLDTVNRRWVATGTLSNQEIGQAQIWPEDAPSVQRYREIEKQYDQRIAEATQKATVNLPVRPTPPRRSASANPTLELDFLNQISLASGSTVSPEDLKEINQGGIWELLPESGNVDLRAFNVVWNSVKLRGLQNDKFELTLINPQKEERLIVRPIMLDDGDFIKAQQRYETELAAFEAAMMAMPDQRSDDVKLLETEKATVLATLEEQILADVEAMPLEDRMKLQQRSASFKFAISSWGIYAVARQIQDLPQLAKVSFDEQEAIHNEQNAQVFYTDGQHKTLYRGLVRNESAQIPLETRSTNARIWIVNEQGELVVAEMPDATSLPAANSTAIQLKTNSPSPLPNSAALLRQKLVLQ